MLRWISSQISRSARSARADLLAEWLPSMTPGVSFGSGLGQRQHLMAWALHPAGLPIDVVQMHERQVQRRTHLPREGGFAGPRSAEDHDALQSRAPDAKGRRSNPRPQDG